MKFLIAFVAIVAVASAGVVKPVGDVSAELQAIVAAINHPSTDPATALLLEQQLFQLLGIPLPEPEPIAVGPAIVDEFQPIAVGPAIVDQFEPIAVGPAIIDQFEPIAVGPAIIPPVVVDPSPVIVAPVETPAASSPLVQIIVNVIAAGSDAPAVNPAAPENVIDVPEPVQIVDVSPVVVPEPVQIVDVMPVVNPEPIQVVDVMPVIVPEPEPVQVVEPALPVLPEPVVIPEPILPEPILVIEPPTAVVPVVVGPQPIN